MPDASAPLADWAAIRVAPLVDPPLVERIGFGAEGGVYRCHWASLETDDSGLQFSLRLTPEALSQGARAAGVVRGMLAMADAANPHYMEDYAHWLRDISLVEGQSVKIRWKKIPVRPEALVRCRARSVPSLAGSLTYYHREKEQEPGVIRFQRRGSSELPRAGQSQPANGKMNHGEGPLVIVERRFRADDAAVEALVRGEVDLLDRVPPWQLEKLKTHDQVVVGPYRLPTIHVLLFNPRTRLLQEREFRRALCYGIDRAGLVRDILLAGQAIDGFRPVSGPFPAGESRHDPVGYAYNQQLSVRPYEPRLAAVLAEVARVAVANVAEETKVTEEAQVTEEAKVTEAAQGTVEMRTKAVTVAQAPEVTEPGGSRQKAAIGTALQLGPEQDRPGEFQPKETQPLVLLYPPNRSPAPRASRSSCNWSWLAFQLSCASCPMATRLCPGSREPTTRSLSEWMTTICFTPSWPCGNRWLTPDACWDREE